MEPNHITYSDYQRACQLATDSGFYKAYYAVLPQHRTSIEAFLAVNEETFNHFGEHRYTTYEAFRSRLSRYLKRNRKK